MSNSFALGREHGYKITVVNNEMVPQANIEVKTLKVQGYDQSSAACVTALNGQCTLTFTAFAPSNTTVIVSLREANQKHNVSRPFTLGKVQNSWFSNYDFITEVLVFEIDSTKERRGSDVTKQKRWAIDSGPALSEIVLSQPLSIADFIAQKQASTSANFSRDKFETDEEYEARSKRLSEVFFFVGLPFKDGGCSSQFIHAEALYKVKCNFSSSTYSLAAYKSDGGTFVLSNAFDQRSVKRVQSNVVQMPIAFEWDAEFRLDRDAARFLENDLAIGFLSSDKIKMRSTCGLCDSRDAQDSSERMRKNLNDLSESLSAVTGRRSSRSTYTPTSPGWKDDAFREGAVLEDWTHSIDGEQIKSVVIFRKSDKKVLFHSDL
jgi:hypothetical protein